METTKNPKEIEVGEEELEEIMYEDADSYGEIIYAAYNAYSMVDCIDELLVSQETCEMIKEIKENSLKLVNFAISAIYENNISEEEAI
jgi:hypothetical protein